MLANSLAEWQRRAPFIVARKGGETAIVASSTIYADIALDRARLSPI